MRTRAQMSRNMTTKKKKRKDARKSAAKSANVNVNTGTNATTVQALDTLLSTSELASGADNSPGYNNAPAGPSGAAADIEIESKSAGQEPQQHVHLPAAPQPTPPPNVTAAHPIYAVPQAVITDPGPVEFVRIGSDVYAKYRSQGNPPKEWLTKVQSLTLPPDPEPSIGPASKRSSARKSRKTKAKRRHRRRKARDDSSDDDRGDRSSSSTSPAISDTEDSSDSDARSARKSSRPRTLRLASDLKDARTVFCHQTAKFLARYRRQSGALYQHIINTPGMQSARLDAQQYELKSWCKVLEHLHWDVDPDVQVVIQVAAARVIALCQYCTGNGWEAAKLQAGFLVRD